MDKVIHDFLIQVFTILGFQNPQALLEDFLYDSLQLATSLAKTEMDAAHLRLFEQSLRFSHSVQSLDQIFRNYVSREKYILFMQQASQYTLSKLISSRGFPLSPTEKEQLAKAAQQIINN